jgi:hypothetical protein
VQGDKPDPVRASAHMQGTRGFPTLLGGVNANTYLDFDQARAILQQDGTLHGLEISRLDGGQQGIRGMIAHGEKATMQILRVRVSRFSRCGATIVGNRVSPNCGRGCLLDSHVAHIIEAPIHWNNDGRK